MATLFRAPLYSLRWARSASRVPHTAQADVTANRGLLFGKDKFFAAPGQAPTYDWPNPQRRDTRFPIDGRSHLDPSEFFGLLKDTFFGGPGQPPTYQPPQNPLRAAFPLEDRSYTDPTEFWLLVPTQAPFNQEDWPNPTGPRPALENKTEADGSEFWLLKDSFFGGPGQPPSPTPAAALRIAPFPSDLRTWTQSHLLDTLAPTTATPFAQTDWPNPARPTGVIDNRVEADGSEFWLLKDQFFGAAGQPPSPTPAASLRLPVWSVDLRTWTQTHVLDTLAPVTATPFASLDWPNPTLKSWIAEHRTYTDPTEFWLLKDTFFGGPSQPPAPFALPNPRIAPLPIDARTWLQDLLSSTLAPSTPPPSLKDWPNPRGGPHPISLRTIAEFTRLLGKDRIFGGAGQPITIWPQPNPLGPRYPISLRTSTLGLAAFYQNLASLGTVHCADVEDLTAIRTVLSLIPDRSTLSLIPVRTVVSLNPERSVLLLAMGLGRPLFDPVVFDPDVFDTGQFLVRLTVVREPEC